MNRNTKSTARQKQLKARREEDIARLLELNWEYWHPADKWHKSGSLHQYSLGDAIALEQLRGNIKRGRKAK